MSTLRILYQMARADFLERVRRYSFLVMLGLVVWIGYLSASGQFRMTVGTEYAGIVNSAWVGGTMTVTVSVLLGFVGFYIVKGSINRDYTTGVGQIMATTPLTRPLYMLGKWLSNVAVLGITIIIVLLEGILMTYWLTQRARPGGACCPARDCRYAVRGADCRRRGLVESVTWLRGGLGNVIYAVVFLFALTTTGRIFSVGTPGTTANPYVDFSGWQIVADSVVRAARAAYPESAGGFSFGMIDLSASRLFLWNGVSWTADIVLSRLLFLAIAAGLVMLSALFFDRFDPSRPLPVKRAKTESGAPQPATTNEAVSVSNVHLTPLADTRTHSRFGALFIAELRLFLKGQRWWWYAVAAGLVVAQLVTELAVTRYLLLVAWVWPALILSGLGCRGTASTHARSSSLPRIRSPTAARRLALCIRRDGGIGLRRPDEVHPHG